MHLLINTISTFTISLALVAALLGTASAATPAFDYGDIKEDYLPPSPWPVVEYKDPGDWTTIDVSKHGLKPDADVDAAKVVAKIIADTKGRRRLFFPKGTYTLKSNLVIEQGDIWLDGAGKGKTKFVLDFPKGKKINGISIKGRPGRYSPEEDPIPLASIPKRGDATVEVAGAHDFKVGDLVRVFHKVKDNRGYGFPRGQLSWITAVDGKTITLDLKIGADLAGECKIRREVPLMNVRVTNFSIERLRNSKMGDHNLMLVCCANAEVRNVESSKARTFNILLFGCRDVIVRDCLIHELWVRKGFNGYGVTAEWSTGINVVNNYGYDLRHNFELAWGTSYSVVAYNTTEGKYSYADVGSHHADLGYCNLFEGNQGQDVVLDWGEADSSAYTFMYRNKVSRRLGCYRPKRGKARWYPVIIGNENTCEAPINMPRIGTQGAKHPYMGANIVQGDLKQGDVPKGSDLPASLFLSAKPDYLEDKEWPLFGPPVRED